MGSIVNKKCLMEEFNKIDKHSDNSTKKRCILLIADDSLEAVAIYCYYIYKNNTVFLVGNKKEKKDYLDIIFKFKPDVLYIADKIKEDLKFNIIEVKCLKKIEYIKCYDYNQFSCYKLVRGYNKKNINSKVALLMCTSGSVGNGKIVALSYKNLKSNAKSIIEALHIKQGQRGALMLPMSYVYGLSVINSYLLADGEILLPETSMFRKQYWDFLEKNNVNSFCGVPYTYELMNRLRVFDREWKGLKLITQAGGVMNQTLKERLLAYTLNRKKCGEDIHLAIMYGQTEATARMSIFFLDEHPKKIESVGKAIPGGYFEIIDKNIDGNGEIIYYGDNVCMGYVGGIEDLYIENNLIKDKLYTGDIGRLDADGYLYITGRKKRFIKNNGVRISLDELERELGSIILKEIVCFEDNNIVCILVKDDGDILDVNNCMKKYLCGKRIQIEKIRVKFIKEFFYLNNGKIDYRKMNETYSV